MCILIIRSWSSCGHMRATSTDKCHTCLANPGMMEYDCPRATTYYPDIEPDWPCPVCQEQRRAEFGTLLQPDELAREALWEIEQAANHSNTSLFATGTSFGRAASEDEPLPGPELVMPQLRHEVRSNAPSPSPHRFVETAAITEAMNESTVSLRTDYSSTASSFGGVALPEGSSSTNNLSSSSLPTGSTVTLSTTASSPLHVPSELFTVGEASTYTGDQNTSRAPTVLSEAQWSGVPQHLYKRAIQDEATIGENERLSLRYLGSGEQAGDGEDSAASSSGRTGVIGSPERREPIAKQTPERLTEDEERLKRELQTFLTE